MRVRHFGLLANRSKKQALAQCRKLLGVNPTLPPIPQRSAQDLLLELTGIDLTRCPACKKGTMIIVAELPKVRPWDSSSKTSLPLQYHRDQDGGCVGVCLPLAY